MPNFAITVSETLPKTHFQKAVGGVKKFFCGHSSRMEVTSDQTLIKTVQLTCKRFFQTVSLRWEANIFTSDNVVLTLFCFLKTMCVHALGYQESDFQSSFYAFACLPQTNAKTSCSLLTHSLVITPQPKGAIFSHRKRWVVPTG